MRILVTGGTGFVGRHLIRRLEAEHEVIAPPRSVLDLETAIDDSRLPAAVDAVVHSAARIDPSPTMRQVNAAGTRAVMEWAARAGAARVLVISTGGVYGPRDHAVDEREPLRPAGDYAVSKAESERIAEEYRGSRTVSIARLYFPFGAGQEGRFIPNLARRIAAGEAVSLAGPDGIPISMTYIDDAVEALLRLLLLDESHTVNVAAYDTCIRELASIIGQLAGREPQFTIGAPQGGYLADTKLLRQLTGFQPTVPLRDGLAPAVGR